MKVILFLHAESDMPVETCETDAVPHTVAGGQVVLEVVDGVAGTLADSTLMPGQSTRIDSLIMTRLTDLLLEVALISFSRKWSQSLLSDASSTTISL